MSTGMGPDHRVRATEPRSGDSRARTTPGSSAATSAEAEWRVEQLRHENDDLHALLDCSGAAIVLLDAELRVRRVSAACSRLAGLRSADVGRRLDERQLLFDDPDLFDDLRCVLAGERIPERELRKRDGRWLLRRTAPMLTSAGQVQGIVLTLVDVTWIKAMSEPSSKHDSQQRSLAELRRVHERLRAVDERKDEFLAILGHELRNPLSGLHGGLALLELELPPERVLWTRQMMKRQVAQMVSLLDDVLDISRISHGKLRLRRKRIAVRLVVERAVASALSILEARRHVLRQEVDDVDIDADPTRLEQVLVNLLTNAAKFTPEGGTIELSAREQGGSWVLQVKDDGPGVPEEMREVIFEPFVQVAGGRYAREGLGIGLALVKQLVEMHDGTTSVDSNGERGAVFTITLPVAAADGPTSDRATPSRPALCCDPPCRRILLVEDKQELAETLALGLQQRGLEVRVAADGESALEKAERWRPDAMIIDIGLPTMSGIDLAREVRRTPLLDDTVLIALSGYSHSQARCDAFEAGFDEHIAKPADGELLLRMLGHGDWTQ